MSICSFYINKIRKKKAKLLVSAVFSGKKDLGGKDDYINHLLRVSSNKEVVALGEKAVIVGLLHDLIEDHGDKYDEQYLRNHFGKEITEAVVLLTHKDSDMYKEYISKIKNSKNKIAIAVKLADLQDNMDTSRLPTLRDNDIRRLKKYHEALGILKNKII